MARRIVLNANDLIISKPGADALSGVPDDQLFDGVNHNSRVVMSGVISRNLPYNGSNYVATVYHNLGYIPVAIVSTSSTIVAINVDTAALNVYGTADIGDEVNFAIYADQWSPS